MMFYDREKEKAIFEQMLSDDSAKCQILNLSGEGGIGKTTLLLEAYIPMTTEKGFLSAGLIDLYETEFSRVSTLMQEIAQNLNPDGRYFDEYYKRREEFRMARQEGQQHVLAYLERKERDVFLDCYNQLADDLAKEGKKIVLFFDTFERAARGSRVRIWLFSEFFPKMTHTVVVLSGRGGEAIEFPSQIEKCVTTLSLAPLPNEDAEEIFTDQIQGRVGQAYLNEFVRLSGGKPLNVLLIVNWINHTQVTLNELKSLHPEDIDLRLAEEIWRQVTYEEGYALLALAHIRHRFNQEILEHVAESDADTAKAIMDALDQRLDIKVRHRSGYYQPHDRVRELVHQYIFPKHDPRERTRQDLSQRMLQYYDRKLAEDLDTPEKQTLIAERLYHELVVDFERGLAHLQEEIEHARESYQHGFWAILLSVAEEFHEYIEFVGKRRENISQLVNLIKVYRGWLLTLSWQFDEADRIIQQLVGEHTLSSNIQALALRLAARNFRSQGKFEEAIEMGKAALQTYEALLEVDPENKQLQADIASLTNEMGFTYRQLGNLSEAVTWFDEALLRSREFHRLKLRGYVLNNLGDTYRLLGGNIQKAFSFCWRSLKLREQLGYQRDIAISHNTIARIYRDDGQFAKAKRHFRQSMSLFEEVGDLISLADARRNLGYTHYLANEFERALNLLEESRKTLEIMNINSGMLKVFNVLGRVYRKKGDLDLAEEYHQEALRLARQYRDFFFTMDTLVELCRTNYARSQQVPNDQKERYYQKVYEYERELRQLGENNLAWFRLELVLGDVARDKGKYEEAIIHWGKSFAYIARRSRRRFEICLA